MLDPSEKYWSHKCRIEVPDIWKDRHYYPRRCDSDRSTDSGIGLRRSSASCLDDCNCDPSFRSCANGFQSGLDGIVAFCRYSSHPKSKRRKGKYWLVFVKGSGLSSLIVVACGQYHFFQPIWNMFTGSFSNTRGTEKEEKILALERGSLWTYFSLAVGLLTCTHGSPPRADFLRTGIKETRVIERCSMPFSLPSSSHP